MKGKGIITGIVSNRKCSQCGHHEVGIVTSDGDFYPLRPGMYVQVFSFGQQSLGRIDEMEDVVVSDDKGEKGTESTQSTYSGKTPWLPDILRRNKRLRLRYGVILKPEEVGEMDELIYKRAYIRKIQDLVEKEIYPDLAVILDTFFQSPHLAAGNSAEVTINILRDIDEVRRPMELMVSWLNDKTEDSLNKLISPFSKDELEIGEPVSEEELMKELNELTLMDFLKTL